MSYQISASQGFGKEIVKVLRSYKFKSVLEIGSCNGEGSTKCLIEGMKRNPDPRKLVCIEANPGYFEGLLENTRSHPWIRCNNRSSISWQDFQPKTFDEVWNSPHNGLAKKFQKELVNKWYIDDVIGIQKEETTLLREIFEKEKFECVFIDGCEFTGYSEFCICEELNPDVKCYILDDCYEAYKTNQALKELLSKGWKIVAEDRCKDRNGSAILMRG